MKHFFLILLVLMSAAACKSNTPARRPPASFDDPAGAAVARPISLFLTMLDSNQDAALTREELDAQLPPIFASFDSDKDSNWSLIEYGNWSAIHLGAEYTVPMALQTDKNSDGKITFAEFRDISQSAFAKMDANADGSVMRSEMLISLPRPPAPNPEQVRELMEQAVRARRTR